MKVSHTTRRPITARRIAALTATTFLALGFISAAHDAGEAHASKLPIHTEVIATACAQEDGSGSTLPCFWNARTMGNGEGHSFTVHRVGDNLKCFTYWGHRYNNRHGFCTLLREENPRKVQMTNIDGHESCMIRIGPTSYGVCPDGYRFSS